jgi:hypothetical protein
MRIKLLIVSLITGLVSSFGLPMIASAATISTDVTPSNPHGWLFNADPSTATPYEFTNSQHSIGSGSLYITPIGTNASDKFIALKPLGIAVASLSSVAYDFLIAGNGDATDANQFYLNVYTNLPGSTSYYECRFDYAPTTGSTSEFTTASFNANDTPVNVASRGGATCPATLAQMPEGSTISTIALNVGDTTTSDTGLAGYLDKVVVTTVNDVITYDFEKDPVMLANKEACKNGGWTASELPIFKSQGDCVSSFASNGKAKGNPVMANNPTF